MDDYRAGAAAAHQGYKPGIQLILIDQLFHDRRQLIHGKIHGLSGRLFSGAS